MHKQQQNNIISLSGRRYYRLHCALSDTKDNAFVTGGPSSRMYTQKSSKTTWSEGAEVSKSDTKTLTWCRTLLGRISRRIRFQLCMFFGPPLSSSRYFIRIFQDVKSPDSLHHKFMCYYDHFFGDANACMSLLNAYLVRRLHLLEAKYTKDVAKVRSPNGCKSGTLMPMA